MFTPVPKQTERKKTSHDVIVEAIRKMCGAKQSNQPRCKRGLILSLLFVARSGTSAK